ncbi:MAG: ABC transporter permease [Acidobacteria bacterium]|nr:MAG: ABC transporter permease [Acidobacteriota bacterium]
MRWIYKLPLRLRSLLRKQRVEEELGDELRFHLEKLIEENAAKGMTPEEARYAAMREFGGMEQMKEECRDSWGVRFINELGQDIRYGLRQLRRNPGFTIVAVLTLALGIGVNTAIFSAVDVVILKFLPVSHPDQLVLLQWQSPHAVTDYLPYPTFDQLRKQNNVFTGLAAFHNLQVATRVGREHGLAAGQLVSSDFFFILGVRALIGRTFASGEDQSPGADPFAVISYRYWQNRFRGSPAVLGSSIELNGVPFIIIGVMPPSFFGVSVGDSRDVWVPLMMQAQVMGGKSTLNDPQSWWLNVMGRRKPGVNEEQAAAAINVLYQRIARQQAGTHLSSDAERELSHEQIALVPAGRGLSTLRERMSEPLIVLMVLVGFVLLVACANVASLILARAATRKRELAVRVALGAGGFRVFRQLLTESLLLATLGGSLGLLFARWGDDLLLALMSEGGIPFALNLHLNSSVFVFTVCITLMTGLLCGSTPAWEAARVNLSTVIKASGRGLVATSKTRQSRWELRKLLVTGEVAMALVLVVGAGMLVSSLQQLKDVNPGFDQDHVLLASLDPTLIGYRGNRLVNFYRQVTLAVAALPGVRCVSPSALPPITSAQWRTGIFVQGHVPGAHEKTTAQMNFIGPGYFRTLSIPLLQGREFTPRDNAAAPKVAVINETMARFYFGHQSAVGKRLSFVSPEAGEIEIVGVASDSKYNSLREATPHMIYVPYLQTPPASLAYGMTLEIRTSGNPDAATGMVRQAIRETDNDVPILGFATLAQTVSESLAQERLVARLSTLFGILALVLASIGLYGVMAYNVARRTGEIGIRMALGARRTQMLGMVLREALELVALGAALGIPMTIAFAALISSQLYGVSPADPLTILASTVILGGVALIASYIPARRAAKVDPMVALRYE